MIDRKFSGKDLIGRKCRPVRPFHNGGGEGVSPDTICTVVNVIRGHGFTIKTEKCQHCGQYAYISRVSRNDLELVEAEE